MKEVDYIIVGCGLASIAFCEQLRVHNKTFVVFDDNSQQSSIVAAGMYNPVILKRFSEVWKAKEQLDISIPVYNKIEDELDIKVDHKLQLLRRFSSIEEQNLWFSAADKPKLEPFLSTTLVKNTNEAVDAPYSFGEVLHAGRLDTEKFIESYKTLLRDSAILIEERFKYEELETALSCLQYADIRSHHIVFAEGYGLKNNPYFSHLPLNGTKGEVLTIRAPKLNLKAAIKSSVFIIPIGNDLYTVGSTYRWDDKTNAPTEAAKTELLSKLKTFIKYDFEVVKHVAGIRPTVKDRRPLVGQHPEYANVYVLNGLGTRGVMIAPYVADKLFQYIENNKPLDAEIDINRFSS
ncbi:NAD(P)/FAD-dependent oxidoreductase [Winogradskyella tangerina]|uniref:NAD(P)/FAD-dependent oxidoreductase n=1 Tax=Winogradskyella tangerina TaxID=2023240 RepID=UPI000DBE92D7|nr:FAD-binding oxidoreductase [Winogradskyella tangerina]